MSDDDKSQAQRDREMMNAVLKKHTVCGELIVETGVSKALFLKDPDHADPQCAKDLKGKGPDFKLESMNAAIERLAREEVVRQNTRSGKTGAASGAIDATEVSDPRPRVYRERLYRATDEVLGLIPRKDWKDAVLSDKEWENASALEKAKSIWNKLVHNGSVEKIPDNGLKCEPSDPALIPKPSISNVNSCKVETPKAR